MNGHSFFPDLGDEGGGHGGLLDNEVRREASESEIPPTKSDIGGLVVSQGRSFNHEKKSLALFIIHLVTARAS